MIILLAGLQGIPTSLEEAAVIDGASKLQSFRHVTIPLMTPLIIVGGIGSLPGVVVGSAVLIGLPELLREFSEYRQLIYGALLVATMILKPEGLWPSPIRRRELHAEEDIAIHEGPMAEDVHELV